MTVPKRNVKKRTRSMSPMTSISCNQETEDEVAVCKCYRQTKCYQSIGMSCCPFKRSGTGEQS